MNSDDEDFDERPTPDRQKRSWPKLTDSEARRHHRSWVRGVPVVRPEPDNEMTAPLEMLLNGRLDVDDYAQVEALRRSSDDVYVLLMNLARALSRYRDRDKSGEKEIEAKVLAAIEGQARQATAMAERIDVLEDDNRETKRKLAFWQKVAGGALALAITASGAFVTKIWDRAGDEREAKVEAKYAKEELDKLSKQVERLLRKDSP